MMSIQDAAKDMKYLLDRNYPRSTSLNLVVNHYGLEASERNHLLRYVYSDEEIENHKSKLIPLEEIGGGDIVVDTYNVLITVEVIFSGASVVRGMDGFLRDNSAMFSGYRFTEKSKEAIEKVLELLSVNKPSNVLFILDAPISKSGELAALLREKMSEYSLEGDARTTDTADYEIKSLNAITATTDSVIIESVDKVIDIGSAVLEALGGKEDVSGAV